MHGDRALRCVGMIQVHGYSNSGSSQCKQTRAAPNTSAGPTPNESGGRGIAAHPPNKKAVARTRQALRGPGFHDVIIPFDADVRSKRNELSRQGGKVAK